MDNYRNPNIYSIKKTQIYSQSSQTPLTDCFTLTGSSEGNLIQIDHQKGILFYLNKSPFWWSRKGETVC